MIGFATLSLLFPLTDDIKCDLNAIQDTLKDKTKRSAMAKPLSQFIQFHSNAKELSLDFTELIKKP